MKTGEDFSVYDMAKLISNYHTHTERCHHAVGSDEQFILAAIDKGIKTLGFSDHGPWPFKFPYKSGMRMTVKEAEGYFKSLLKLKELYKNKINILIGFEYEYFPQFKNWLGNFIKRDEIDYIILGQHFCPDEQHGPYAGDLHSPEGILNYRDWVIEGMQTGYYSYVCHPDLYMTGYQKFDRFALQVAEDICKEALKLDMPVEYNVYGVKKNADNHFTGYPYPNFWDVAKACGNKVVIGIDAHFLSQIEDETHLDTALAFLKEKQINYITEIPMKRV